MVKSFHLLFIYPSFLSQEYMGVKISNYILCISVIIFTILLKKYIAILLAKISSKFTNKFSYIQHKQQIRSMLLKPLERLLVIIAFSFAINQLSDLTEQITVYHIKGKNGYTISLSDISEHLFLFLLILFLTQVINRVIDFIYFVHINKALDEKNNSSMQLLPLIKELSKLLIWALSLFWILGSVFHVNVPALITGLGIGGVAIALAGKETVENFFAAFTILSDRPFQVGDYIRMADFEGTVERIGFRSTKLRSLNDASISIPNQKLVSQNLMNLSDRTTQGIKTVFNITYGISSEKLTELLHDVATYLENDPVVMPEIEVLLITTEKETLQLQINYHISFPLSLKILADTKTNINLSIYQIINGYGALGFQGIKLVEQ